MRLSAPSVLFFLISLILFAAGCLGYFEIIKFAYVSYALIAAWVVLALGCLFRGI